MKLQKQFFLLLALPALLLAACSKDNDVEIPKPSASGIVLVDGTHDAALLKTALNVLNPEACVSLFTPLSEADSLALASSSEICIVADGSLLTDDAVRVGLKDAWTRFYSHHKHKLLLIYDGREAWPELTAQLIGFNTGNNYYVRSFGKVSYSQEIEQASMNETQLSKAIGEIRERRNVSAAAGNDDVSQLTFVRPLRFNFYRASDQVGNNSSDILTTGKDVEKVSAGQRSLSAYGDFLVKYTIYSAKGYSDHNLSVELDGAGFTTNILRRVDRYKVTDQGYTPTNVDVAQSKNFVRSYNMTLEAKGKTMQPSVIQTLPASENSSITISQTYSAQLGFKISKSDVISGDANFSYSHTVAYDQPSFSTRSLASADGATHSVKRTWETKPVTGYKGIPAWSGNDLGIANLFYFYTDHVQNTKTYSECAEMYDLTIPARFPIPFYSFSPQVLLLMRLEDNEVTIEAGAEVELQDDKYDPYDKNNRSIYHWKKGATDRVKITFADDDTIIWQ